MIVLKTLKKLLSYTSIYFTVCTTLYAILQIIVNVTSESPAIEMYRLLFIALFSLLAGISSVIYGIKSIHPALRVLIQYVIIALAAFVCFFMSLTGTQIIIGLVLVTVIYFACFGVASFFSWRFKENTKKEEVYEKKFKKNK